MDESTIVAQLAQGIPQDNPSPTPPKPTSASDEPSAFHSNVELNIETQGQVFTDYFQVDRVGRWNEETQRQLRDVYKWAATKAGTQETRPVLDQIIQLETELGIVYKPHRLQRLARWVELERKTEAFRAQQEMIRYG